MPVQWEGDAGNACVDENPFVWIRSGGRYGPNEVDQVKGDTFQMSFANQGGENRIYFDGGGAYAPTIGMNWPLYPTGGFEILLEVRNFGHPMGIVYRYDRVPDDQVVVPTNTPTVQAKAISGRSLLWVDVDPNQGSAHWTFQVQVRGPDGTWTALPRTFATRGGDETRTLNLPKGVYRVVTKPKDGYAAGYSSEVRLVR